MKDSPYLTHDLGARNDPKLLKLQMEMGGKGIGIYWCIVEMLWENDGRLPLESATIAFSLRWATAEDVQNVILNYGLFDNDGKMFWSPSALDRISERERKFKDASERARNAASSRWKKADECTGNADAMQAQCGGNATNLSNYTNYTNKQTYISQEPPTADDTKRILEIFFFDLNFTEPAAEVQRFIDHYSARGWVFGDGTPVVDKCAAARKWIPEDKKKGRLSKSFLGWFKALYVSISENPGLQASILSDLAAGDMKGDRISMTFRTREIALELRAFVGNHFGNKFSNIDWRLLDG